MLVLSRRIGQQIVLPGCGVTIDVIGVTRSRVRLAIEAPADVLVYRTEILDRVHHQCEIQPGAKAELKDQAATLADGPESPNTTGTSLPDLDQCMTEWVARRTNGRIRQLSVKTVGDRTVISGWATSYYARQLAQAAVNEMSDNWTNSLPIPNVEYEIDIVDRSFVSRTGAIASFRSHVRTGQNE